MELSAQEKCKLAGLLARYQTPDPDGVGARLGHALPGLPEGSSLSPFSSLAFSRIFAILMVEGITCNTKEDFL